MQIFEKSLRTSRAEMTLDGSVNSMVSVIQFSTFLDLYIPDCSAFDTDFLLLYGSGMKKVSSSFDDFFSRF